MGTLTLFVFQKQQIRREMSMKIGLTPSKTCPTLFKICSSRVRKDLQWKDDREFIFNGHMYDVISQNKVGDTILIYCYKDHAETKLHKQFARMISAAIGDNPVRKNQNERLISFFKSFCTDQPRGDNLVVPELKWDGIRGERKMFYCSFIASPPVPPPKA